MRYTDEEMRIEGLARECKSERRSRQICEEELRAAVFTTLK